MKPSLLLTNHYEGTPLQILDQAVAGRFNLLVLPQASQEELYRMAPEADYMLVSGRLKIDREVLDRAAGLKMIQRTGVGLDSLDLDYIRQKGLPLYVNRGVNAVSVAEHTLMLMLASLKRSYQVNLQMRQGIWRKQATGLTTHEIYGKTIGLIGMGSIGQAVARMLRGFGVHIYYYDMIRLDEEREQELAVTYADFSQVLAQADVLSLHCGYDPKTGPLLGREELSLMKEGAILINTARGKLVSQEALIEALDQGRLAACGIDTFEEEPPAGISPLAAYDQVLLSPHIAGVSYEAFSRMMRMAVDNISHYHQGDLQAIEENRRI